MTRGPMLLVVACIAGCSATTTATPDATIVDDAPHPGSARLTIVWLTDLGLAFPADLGSSLRVDDVKLRMENLHADTLTSPGAPRTTRDELQLHWNSAIAPGTVVFADAPAGFYSNVILKLDQGDGEDAFEIEGSADVAGDDTEFQISDTTSLSISTSCDLDLQPGADMTLLIEIRLAAAIAAVDYEALPENNDKRILDKNDPQIAAFRQALQMGFSVTVQPTSN